MHLPSLAFLADQFLITALCDTSDDVLQSVADHWQVPKRYRDYRDLVAEDDVDAVLVANPSVYHSQATLAAIETKKNVLVEKPMCFTLREADLIVAAQERTDVIVQVGTMRRYAPAFVEACRILPEFGEIRLARVHDVLGMNALIVRGTSRVIRPRRITQEMTQSRIELEDRLITEVIGNRHRDLRSAYALLLSLGSHDASAMRELLGNPRNVLYAAQRHGGSALSAAFDYGTFVCHFEIGFDAIPRFDAHLEVYCKERVLRVVYDTPYVRNLPIRLSITEANGESGVMERVTHPSWGDAFVAEWQAFYGNITSQSHPKTSPVDSRNDLELFRDMIGMM